MLPESQTSGSDLVGLEEVRVETSAFISSDVQPGLKHSGSLFGLQSPGRAFYFFKF